MKSKQEHVVVVGGCFTGCSVAETLSHYFNKVTVIDKEDFNDNLAERKSVPQENQPHILLLKGKQILDSVFPSLSQDLINAGAYTIDMGQLRWYQYGVWKNNYDTGVMLIFFSRRLLDNLIRKRIRANPKITVLSNHTVENYLFDSKDNNRVKGVKVKSCDGTDQVIVADLVVDASGRGSRTAILLKSIGINVPETLIKTNSGYVTRLYKIPKLKEKIKPMIIWPKTPEQKRLALFYPIENDNYIVTTGGWLNEFPKPENVSFFNALEDLPTSDLFETVKNAEPASNFYKFCFPGSLWRHYEAINDLPEGLLVIGAALCSANPFYGRGMTLALLQVDCIRNNIATWINNKCSSRYIQSSFTKTIVPSWELTLLEDTRFPEVMNKPSLATRIKHWYSDKFVEQTKSNLFARQVQMEITHMLAPNYKVVHPKLVTKIIFNSLFHK